MNKPTIVLQGMLLIALACCFAISTALAQDFAKVVPNNVKVLLDNDQVRVLDVQAKAGEKVPMHSHPAGFVYSMGTSKVKTTSSDGKVVETELKAGEAK